MECFRYGADVFTKEAQHKIAVAFQTACEWHGARMPDDIRAMLENTQFPGGKTFSGDLHKTAGDRTGGNIRPGGPSKSEEVFHHDEKLRSELESRADSALANRFRGYDDARAANDAVPPPSGMIAPGGSSAGGERFKAGSKELSDAIGKRMQTEGGKSRRFTEAADSIPRAMAKESSHALMLEYPDGQVARFYAMPDHESVKTAAAYFEEHHRSLHPTHRRTYATSVEKRASELGVHDLERGPALSKYAAADFGPSWPEALEYRHRLVGQDSRAGQAYEKLAGAIAAGNVAFPDAANYLGELDALAGVRSAGDPWASLAGGRKVASGFSDEIDGDQVTDEMLAKAVDSKQLLQLYGKSFMKEFSKRPTEVFSSLPDDDKRVVKEVLYGRA
jgi:hypothetical protein